MTFDESYIREVLTLKIKESWLNEKTCLPDFLPLLTKEQRGLNEKRISDKLDRFQKQMNAFSPLPGRKKRWRRDMDELLHEILLSEPLFGIAGAMSQESLCSFEEELREMFRRIRKFDPGLTMESVGQALRNYIVYAVFRELNGLPQSCTPEIFGYSMLYPYTDNFMDAPGRSGEEKRHYTKLIANKLQGKECDPVTEHDRKTVTLLDLAGGSHPKPDDTDKGLLLILKAQKDSQKQSDRENPLPADQVLGISIFKGGFSVVLDRYYIGTPLTEKDYEFYYGFGFLLQLCDDLQDLSIDRESGCRTVFSISRSKEETVLKVNQLLHSIKSLFASCECDREEFKEFLMQNCFLLVLTSAAGSKEYMTKEWLAWLEKRLPVSMDYLEELMRGFSPEALIKENKEFMKMLDTLVGR